LGEICALYSFTLDVNEPAVVGLSKNVLIELFPLVLAEEI